MESGPADPEREPPAAAYDPAGNGEPGPAGEPGSCRARAVLQRVGDKWSMYVIDLLGQTEIWREDSGEVIPLALIGAVDRARVLRSLDEQAHALFAEWLVEATPTELAEAGVAVDDDGELETPVDPQAWLAARPLVRFLRRPRAACA